MELHKGSLQNEADLKNFFESFPLKGLVDLKIQRPNGFFSFYQIHSDDYLTFFLKDSETQTIEAMASFYRRNVMLQGQPTTIAQATDLRVSSSRKAKLEWMKHFHPVVEEVKNLWKVEHFFSILDLSDISAHNIFIRPRAVRRYMPRYWLYRRFNLVSLHGQFPGTRRNLPHVRIRDGQQVGMDALVHYLAQRSEFRPLSTVWDKNSFLNKIQRLSQLQLRHFLVAVDANDNIIGTIAPWDGSEKQSYIPLSYSLPAHNFRQFLKFGRLWGWTHTLTKPKSRTQSDLPLHFKYLTHLNALNEDVFESLLYAAYHQCEKDEFLVYSHCHNDFRLKAPLTWVHANHPHGLYLVLPDQTNSPWFMDPKVNLNPEIEPYLI